ncbi:DUF6360 family protein [Natrialbaceae archaeon GCM10025810]|uniref:DUF6360 family protein n=1 Tax=Halovalidus salilacus TaxID=3075124 RepID=UPI00360A604A
MSSRLMTVNAYTTLDLVDAVVTGHEFESETYAVVNATADEEGPDRVRLQFELDTVAEERLPAHMTDLELTPAQARTLAAELEGHADRVEDAAAGSGAGG